jgi:NitT/TauT family transport system ATP-binding protein
MRRWLIAGGIKPDEEVRLVVLPPSQLASCLKAGLIDGFCAGEPWNSVAIAAEAGWCPATSADLDPWHPEKILLLHGVVARSRPDEHAALIRALDQACAFCDAPGNRPAVAEILRRSGYFSRALDVLERSLVGPFDTGRGEACAANGFHIFHRGDSNRPSHADGRRLVSEFLAHGLLPPGVTGTAHSVLNAGWRDDLYDKSLAAITAESTARSPSINP